LLDVTNLSLGVNTKGNKMIKIIARSSPFPIPGKNIFKTVHDNQTEASIKVYEGENESNSENLFLGEFKINLPKRKAGEARIEIY
jgi:molecular chaperone DnaK (HSP70)